ncbi:Uncharacterised protein [Bordetella pertussis]|nr:Uncharacterised protein [Bordetella pertussis]
MPGAPGLRQACSRPSSRSVARVACSSMSTYSRTYSPARRRSNKV